MPPFVFPSPYLPIRKGRGTTRARVTCIHLRSLTRSRTRSLACWLAHSLARSLARSVGHLLGRSLAASLTHRRSGATARAAVASKHTDFLPLALKNAGLEEGGRRRHCVAPSVGSVRMIALGAEAYVRPHQQAAGSTQPTAHPQQAHTSHDHPPSRAASTSAHLHGQKLTRERGLEGVGRWGERGPARRSRRMRH